MCFGSSSRGLCSVSGLEKQKKERKKNHLKLGQHSSLFIFVDSSIWDLCIDRGKVGKNICPKHMSLKNNVTS